MHNTAFKPGQFSPKMQQNVTDVRDSQKLGTLDDVELDHVPGTDSTNQVVAQTCNKNDGDETSVNNQDAPSSALTETGGTPANILSPGANPGTFSCDLLFC